MNNNKILITIITIIGIDINIINIVDHNHDIELEIFAHIPVEFS